MKRLCSCLCIVCFLFISCAQEMGTGDLRLYLRADIAKTLTNGNSILEISRYTIKGNGPGGKTLSADSTSATVLFEGISLGDWKFTVEGYNANGKKIAIGETQLTLSQSTSTATVNLDVLTGTGSLSLKYQWDSEVSNPGLNLKISDIQGKIYYQKEINPGQGRTYHSLNLTDVPCGTFIIEAVLNNSGSKVAADIETMRITNGDKTSGTISFCNGDDYYDNLKNLYVVTTSSPITGSIDGIGKTVASGELLTAYLNIDSHYSSSMEFSLVWYLDGVRISQEMQLDNDKNEISFKSSNGTHILNAVVFNKKMNSVGSASIKFRAKPMAKKGMAVFNSYVSRSDIKSLVLQEDSLISPLPNGRFLVVTPSENIMQICMVYNDSIAIQKTYSGAMVGFGWIGNATSIFSSEKMNVFAVVDGYSNINLLVYNPGSDTIERACFEGEIQRYESGYEDLSLSFSKVFSATFAPTGDGGGTIIFQIDHKSFCLCIVTDATSVTKRGVSLKPAQTVKTVAICGKEAVAFSSAQSVMYVNSFNGLGFSSLWKESDILADYVSRAEFLNQENLVLTDGKKIYKYTKYSKWQWYQTVDLISSFLMTSSDGCYVYSINPEGVLTAFTAITGRLVKIGELNTECKPTEAIRVGNDLVLFDKKAALVLLSIAQEDLI